MTGIRFVVACIAVLLILFLFYRRKIKAYLNSSVYYYCWVLMLVSNLGFPSNIQYLTRAVGLGISWFCIVSHEKTTLRFKNNNAAFLLIIYLCVCGISTMWSASPIQTLLKCIELLTDLILIWLLYSKEDSDHFIVKIFNVTVTVCFVLLTITLAGFFLWPSYFADTGTMASRSVFGIRLGAGLLGANKSSALAALCITWILLLANKRTLKTYVMLIVCIAVMLFSQSRASLALIPVILFLKLYRPKERHRFLYVSLILMALICVFSNFELIYTYLLRGQTAEQLAGGTGRLEIWNSAKTYIAARPLLGYGFGVGGELVAKRLFGIATMHSAIYETLLGIGYIGLILLIMQFLFATCTVIKNTLRLGVKNNLADLILILYFLIRSLTSVGIGNWHSQEIMLWYYFMFAISRGKSIQIVFRDYGIGGK